MCSSDLVQKRIQREILPQIKQYETEYADLLAKEFVEFEISDKEAETTVAEIQDAVALVQKAVPTGQAEGIVKSIKEIQQALKEPITAKGKLKAAIPIIPGIISYQLELDTHSTLMSLWENLKLKFKRSRG